MLQPDGYDGSITSRLPTSPLPELARGRQEGARSSGVSGGPPTPPPLEIWDEPRTSGETAHLTSLNGVARDDVQRLMGANEAQLAIDQRFNRPPSSTGPLLDDAGAPVRMRPEGWSAQIPLGDSSGLGASGDRARVGVDGGFTTGDVTHRVGLDLYPGGTLGVSYGATLPLGSASMLVGGGIVASKETLGGFLSLGAVTPVGVTVSGSAAAYVSGDSGTQVLDLHDDQVRIEWHKQLAGGGCGSVGVGYMGLGISGRLAVSGRKEVIYRAWRDTEGAQRALRYNDGTLKGFVLRKAVTLGIKSPPVQVPNLRDVFSERRPDNLRPDEEVVVTVGGTLSGGVAAFLYGLVPGVYGTFTGESELSVYRRDEDTVDVVVAPKTRAAELMGGLDVPLVAQANAGIARGSAFREGFRFTREGLDAYLKLLDGELPSSSVRLNKLPVDPSASLQDLLRQEILPPGVTRLFAEKVEVPVQRTSEAMVTAPTLIPGAHLSGLGVKKSKRTERHVIAEPSGALYTHQRDSAVEHHMLHRGTLCKRVYAAVRRVAIDGRRPAMLDMVVGARLSAERTPPRVRSGIIHDVNAKVLTDTSITCDALPSSRRCSEVVVERSVSRDKLQDLIDNPPPAPVVESLAQDTGAAPKKLVKLTESLGALQTEERPEATLERGAELVERYVSDSGLEGLGALHRLLDGNDHELQVRIDDPAEEQVLQKARRLQVDYTAPVDPTSLSKHSLRQRFRRVAKVDKRLDDAIKVREALSSVLMSPEHDERVRELKDMQTAVSSLVSTEQLSPDQLQRLRQKLPKKYHRFLGC